VKKQLNHIWVTSLLMFFSISVYAFDLTVEFSADATQVTPGRAPLSSKMYVSKDAVRTDVNVQRYRVIDIAYPKKGKRILIYPDQKAYSEQTGLPAIKSWSGKSVKTPCDGVKDAKCKKMATETLNKRKVNKWQVERLVNGKKIKSLHWIDDKRRIAVKEMFHDGGVSELKMLGAETINGRKVEQWESKFSHPSGQQRVSMQWYDLQLKMVVREELPGGYLREIKNIEVKKQDKSLFEIPKGFKKIENNDNSINNKGIKPAG